jgi:hypothetical protein
LSKKLNILLVAYHFSPDKRVGALRASYWFRNLPSKLDCNLYVITANEKSSEENVHFVPTKEKTLFSRLIKDPGLLWKDNVKSFLKNQTNINPDIVIITGGPFMQFGITKWLKKRYNCKVILDYRDPFATNPGFNNDKVSVIVKKYFERSFNKQADVLITVNSYCAKIIELFDKKKNAIIQNGYDENVDVEIKNPKLSAELNLVYTGKFYFAPDFLVRAVEEKGCVLNYYGADGERIDVSCKSAIDHGLVSYQESLKAIAKSDVGIIQTYGEDFQSTTKLFDYIRCKKPILIISDKFMNRGSIHEELKGYPNVFWAKNSQSDIKSALLEISNHEYKEPEDAFVNKYSRGRQMEKLVGLIKGLNETV